MNEGNSLERRYSFNMAPDNPVAESTHINGSSFSWGSTSPKVRSCSNLNNTTASIYCNDESTVNSKSRNLTKVDARVVADVQSNGLASRIVKYHDSGNRLNRSMSAHNLYSKPGQFPVVTLKRTDLPYRATKKEMSMIRIPPPDKSAFYGNTISSLMRSSSVIELQSKQKEDVSRENRPIIHPPPTENDLAPTRSVLDVLKEISRKRINSDDLESDESSKKYCSRTGNDFVDVANSKASIIQKNFSAPSSLTCQRYKRQRDCVMPNQDVHLLESGKSPEQAKKRVCNYNNDITSSLSSSIKCKRLASVSQNINYAVPPNLDAYEIQTLKEQRHDDHQKNISKNIDINCKILDRNNSIAHVPETACGQDGNNEIGLSRAVSEPYFKSDGKITNSLINSVQKPRLTLFNKNCDDGETLLTSASNEFEQTVSDDLNELHDCAGISFVIPKKIASKRGLRNPVIERTQKSKLALMLSGLRGELYQHCDIDELDSTYEKDKLGITKDSNTNGVLSTKDSANIASTSATVTSATSSNSEAQKNTKPLIQSSSSLNASENKLSALLTSTNSAETSLNTKPLLQSPSSSYTSENKLSSPLVGLKLPKSTNPSSQNSSGILSVDTTKNTELQSTTLDGQTFGVTNTTGSSIAISSSSNITKDSNTTTSEKTSVPVSANNVINAPLAFGDKNQKLSTKIDLPNFQTASVQTTLPSSAVLSSNTPSSPTVSKALTFIPNVNNFMPENNISKSIGTSWSFNTSGKSDNTCNFPSASTLISSTASAPIVFGNLSSAAPITKNTLTNVEAPKATGPASNIVAASANATGSANTPLFNFNSNNTLSTSEKAKPPSGAVAPFSFTVDKNQYANPIAVFGADSFTTKIQTGSSGFNLLSQAKNPDISSGEQNNLETDKKAFKFNAPTQPDSECLKTNATGSSVSLFGKVTGASQNSVPTPLGTTPIFGSSSDKSGTEIFGSLGNSKSSALVTPTCFETNKVNNITSTPFSFTSNSATFVATSSNNNTSNRTGGFSFSPTVSNSNQEKSTNQTSTLNNPSVSVSKNSFMSESSSNTPNHTTNFFGATVNKQPANSTPGGFSFGSTTPAKTATFSFGTTKNSSAIDVTNASNHTTGFVFGTAVNTKQNEVPNNKSFSFGLPQQVQQKQSDPVSNGNSFNIFAMNGATKQTQPPAFNFTSGNSQSNVSTASNIFAQPSSNGATGPGDRPIRRATRRLQK